MTTLPYIFVLDWDGTIAGKVDYQSTAFTIRNTLKRYGYKTNVATIPKAFRPSSKLIRPGFASFLKAMKQFYPEVYFFIYTASEKQWANTEIAWVEKAHDIKFQRPIFTRDDCIQDGSGNYRKSLMRIFPRICRAISRQRPLTKQEREYILHNQVIIIDNNAVYTDKQDRLLLCPDYDYSVFEHLLDMIPSDARKHPEVQQMLLSLINTGMMCPIERHDDEMHAITASYSWIANRCKSIVDLNKSYQNDDFWKYLRKLITQNELRKLTPSIIRQLQDAIWKRANKK
jgi:hypothetical protein